MSVAVNHEAASDMKPEQNIQNHHSEPSKPPVLQYHHQQHPTSPTFTNVSFSFLIIDGISLPQIYRLVNGKRLGFVLVWMVELKLLWRFPNTFPSHLKNLTPLKGSLITEDEALLVNEVNKDHLCLEFGDKDFTTSDFLLVLSEDVLSFYRTVSAHFTDISNCQASSVSKDDLKSMKGGFLQIQNSKCPFVYRKDLQLLPLPLLLHADFNLHLPDNLPDSFGFLPSVKEVAYLNMLIVKLSVNISIGLRARLVSLDLVRTLAYVFVKELPLQDPDNHCEFVQCRQKRKKRFEDVVETPKRSCLTSLLMTSREASILNNENSAAINTRREQTYSTTCVSSNSYISPPQPQTTRTVGYVQIPHPYCQITGVRTVQESAFGTCFMLDIRMSLNMTLALCTVIPSPSLLPVTAPHGHYTVLDNLRQRLFPRWDKMEFRAALKLLSRVPDDFVFVMTDSLCDLFEFTFKQKVTRRERCLLHIDVFLTVLPNLLARYATNCGSPSSIYCLSQSA